MREGQASKQDSRGECPWYVKHAYYFENMKEKY